MDKNAIKKYATWARRELISRVSQKAEFYGVTAKGYGDFNADSIDGRVLSSTEKSQRQALINKVRSEGYKQAMEEVAYTWFNRFSALRYMEVNNYLPTRVRVFTNENGEFKPQIIDEAIHLELDGLDMEKVYSLKDANDTEALYRYLLITQCNALSKIMPVMFQRIDDYTELLLPDYLLREGSVIEQMITSIPEENWREQIEIIGWLYQYYISEKHDQIINIYKGTVQKDDVPAATQLFTTDWVVRYMVDNSLGRYWIERHLESNLADKLAFFVKPKNGEIPYIDEKVEPQDLTFFDCCMGSGHIIVYAFDVLMEIYEECGYTQREAVSEIIQKNLHGFDIDKRCSQLAYFSVMMKARSYDRRFFTRGLQPQTYYPINDEELTTYGSLITVTSPEEKPQEPIELTLFDEKAEDSLNDWNCRRLLSQKYAVVCTNPPYLNKYNNDLKQFVTSNYKAYSGDLFSVFMFRNFGFCKEGGYSAFMTPFVWMFIKTYENLRQFIIKNKKITTLIQMEYSAFEEATVPICTFVLKNGKGEEPSLCFRLSDFKGGMEVQKSKVLEAIANPNCGYFYESKQSNFAKIPGSPVAYWVSEIVFELLSKDTIQKVSNPCLGMRTGDNEKFLRLWHEIDSYKSSYTNLKSYAEKKWVPYNKGGGYRKWYGNNEYLVNWENNGQEIKENTKIKYGENIGWKISNEKFYFKEGITWGSITSAVTTFRYYPEGFIFSNCGQSVIMNGSYNTKILEMTAYLNSNVVVEFLKILSPTIGCESGYVAKLPYKTDIFQSMSIKDLAKENITLSRADWDSFETSWDFKKHPLI